MIGRFTPCYDAPQIIQRPGDDKARFLDTLDQTGNGIELLDYDIFALRALANTQHTYALRIAEPVGQFLAAWYRHNRDVFPVPRQ